MVRRFTAADMDKTVRTAEGRKVGTIQMVTGGRARVRPMPGLSRRLRRRLGWDEGADRTYELTPEAIDHVGDEVRLKPL